MRFGSLFSGIGGFDLGFEQAGMTCAYQVEIDKLARAVLRQRFPNVELYEDVTTINELPRVSLVCGGFPCQDVSVAGQRAGLAGGRSGLWFDFRRIIERSRPQWVVIENVPGLLSSNRGQDFATVVQGLAQLGYGVAWRVLDAQYFGVPQRRRRVFIVGSFASGRAAQILFEPTGGSGNFAASREEGPGNTIAFTERTRNGSRSLESQSELAYALTNPGDGGRSQDRNIAFCTSGQGWWREGLGPLVQRQHKDAENGVVVAYSRRGGFGISESANISPTLTSEGGAHKGGPERVPLVLANCFNGYTGGPDDNDAEANHLVAAFLSGASPGAGSIGYREEQSPTLKGASGGNRTPSIVGDMGVRKLTPLECEKLQGFPPGWTEGQSDSARYRQLGNAVCVPVARWIGERIMALDGVGGDTFDPMYLNRWTEAPICCKMALHGNLAAILHRC